MIQVVPDDRLIGPEPNEGPEHHVVTYGRSLGTEEEPDGGLEGDQQGKDEQREESVRRPSSRGDPLVEVIHRLMDLADVFFGDLVRGRECAGAEREGCDQGDRYQDGDRSSVSFVNGCSPFVVIVCWTICARIRRRRISSASHNIVASRAAVRATRRPRTTAKCS